jgi:REP element-mobilizing transposase RayT
VLVTIRLRAGLPSLRHKREFALIRDRFAIATERFGMRLVEYSVQTNHAHLIVEASDERSLARAMKGLLVRVARGLNE